MHWEDFINELYLVDWRNQNHGLIVPASENHFMLIFHSGFFRAVNRLINPCNGFNNLDHLIDNTLEGLFQAEGLTAADYNRRYFNQELRIVVPHPFAWEAFKGLLYLVDVERG